MWDQEKQELASAELKKFNELCEELFHLRELKKSAEDEVKKINKELIEKKSKVVSLLQANNLPNFRSNKGLVSLREITSAKVVDKNACYSYLKSVGKFEELASINSKTLNSFINLQKEIELEKGNFEYVVPGVEQSEYYDLNMRKK